MTEFATIDDFLVRVTEDKLIEFASRSRGRLAGFPAWEHADRDLRHFIPDDIPLGTRDEPFEDRDESWRIAVFEHGGWVFVAEIDGRNNTAFRVRTEEYLAAWQTLIDRYNPPVALDDLFDDQDPETVQ